MHIANVELALLLRVDSRRQGHRHVGPVGDHRCTVAGHEHAWLGHARLSGHDRNARGRAVSEAAAPWPAFVAVVASAFIAVVASAVVAVVVLTPPSPIIVALVVVLATTRLFIVAPPPFVAVVALPTLLARPLLIVPRLPIVARRPLLTRPLLPPLIIVALIHRGTALQAGRHV
jgi:hypothetical protein